MSDLQAEYDSLVKACAQRDKERTEAETRLKVLKEREAEVLLELAQYGISSKEELEKQIAADAETLKLEFEKIKKALSQPVALKETVNNVDDLLILGSR